MQLVDRGYTIGNDNDGDLGPDTREALIKFQIDHGLAGTGRISGETIQAMAIDLQGEGF